MARCPLPVECGCTASASKMIAFGAPLGRWAIARLRLSTLHSTVIPAVVTFGAVRKRLAMREA